MSDEIISQNEIDNLLNSFENGQSDAPSNESVSPAETGQTQDSNAAGDARMENSGLSSLISEMEKPQESRGSGTMSQDDIDSLISGLESKPENGSSGSGNMSQDDIDALLNGIGQSDSDPEPASKTSVNISEQEKKPDQTPNFSPAFAPAQNHDKKYKLYDFRRPEKLSRDQARKIKTYFEALPRHLTNYLAKMLRSRIEVELIEIDQRNYRDFFKATSIPTILGICTLGPSHPNAIMEFSTHLFYCILERMMGGSGNTVTQIRPITEFEKYMVTDIFNQILSYYRESFSKLSPIYPQVELIEADAQLIPKTLAENEVLVRKIYEIRINGISGYLTISVPYNFIGPFFAKYTYNRDDNSSEKNEIPETLATGHLGHLKIPVSVEFAKSKIRTEDAINISEGKIFMLNHPTSKEFFVKVNGKIKYLGKPGLRGHHMAVRITSGIEEEVMI